MRPDYNFSAQFRIYGILSFKTAAGPSITKRRERGKMDVQREGNVHCQNNTAVTASYHREKNYQTREQKLTLSYQLNPLK